MIVATDLRLGNYFMNDQGMYQQVTIPNLEYLVNSNFIPHYAMRPIPLTPEILRVCGFERKDWDNSKVIGEEYSLSLSLDGFKLFFGWYKANKVWTEFKIEGNGCYDEGGEMGIDETCKYLHQLQTLYYALTGKELEIKINKDADRL